MKKIITIAILILLISFTGCTSYEMIGKVNMISNRNINPKLEYKQLSTFSGASETEILQTNAISIEEAIDQNVRKVAGGEFMMNVKIYKVNKKYFAVEGDVWGNTVNSSEIVFRGFKVGDKVTWKKNGKYKTGKIIAFKDDDTCLVKMDEDDNTKDMFYDELTKIQLNSDDINKKESKVNESTNKYKVGQKVSWTESKVIKYGIIQDINLETEKVVIKSLLEDGQEKITTKYIDEIISANDTDYQDYINKIQIEVKKHTFVVGDKVKWIKNSSTTIHGQVISVNGNDMTATIKYKNDKGQEKNSIVDVFELLKDE